MTRIMWQVGLTLTVGLSLALGTAHADDKPGLRLFRPKETTAAEGPVAIQRISNPSPMEATPITQVHILQPLPADGAMQGDVKNPRFPLLRSCLNQHGIGCYSHHNMIRSGTFHSTATFIFGSSHTFFSESCLPYPPRQNPYQGAGMGIYPGVGAVNGCR